MRISILTRLEALLFLFLLLFPIVEGMLILVVSVLGILMVFALYAASLFRPDSTVAPPTYPTYRLGRLAMCFGTFGILWDIFYPNIPPLWFTISSIGLAFVPYRTTQRDKIRIPREEMLRVSAWMLINAFCLFRYFNAQSIP